MIEILLILHFFRKLSDIAEKKNKSKWVPRLLPIMWIGMQLLFGSIASNYISSDSTGINLYVYGIALLGGLSGAGMAFGLMLFLPPKRLMCPECGWEFTEHGPIGVECKQCKAWLRVTHGRIDLI